MQVGNKEWGRWLYTGSIEGKSSEVCFHLCIEITWYPSLSELVMEIPTV